MNRVSIETVRGVLENYLSGEHYSAWFQPKWVAGDEIDVDEIVEAILVAELHKKSHTAGAGFE